MASPLRKQYSIRPQHLVQSFHDHLRLTGKPHTWPYHTPDKPPKTGIEVLIKDFWIPNKFIDQLGEESKAPCPICCPDRGKYWHGHVLWSSETGTIHAVGHCCGHRYFGGNLLSHSLKREDDRRAQVYYELLLEANWHKPAEFAAYADALLGRAREHDAVVRTLHRGLGQTARNDLVRMCGSTGHLWVTKEASAYARPADRFYTVPFGDRTLAGYSILRGTRAVPLLEARLIAVVNFFRPIRWASFDDAIVDILDDTAGNIGPLCRQLTMTETTLAEVQAKFDALRTFLQRDNLQLLNAWSQANHPVAGRIGVFLTDGRQLSAYNEGRTSKRIILPPSIFDPIPPPPVLVPAQ